MQPNCQPYLSFNECELWEVVYILVQVCGILSFLKLLLNKKKKKKQQGIQARGSVWMEGWVEVILYILI